MTKSAQQETSLVGLPLGELTLAVVQSQEFSEKYNLLCEQLEKIQETKKQIDDCIKLMAKENFLETGDNQIVSGNRIYTYIPETQRETFDSKALKEDSPDIYKKYVKISKVKDSMRTSERKVAVEEERLEVDPNDIS